MRFSPHAGDPTIFQKIASPLQAENRSCSRGFSEPEILFLSLSFNSITSYLLGGSHLPGIVVRTLRYGRSNPALFESLSRCYFLFLRKIRSS